MKRILPLILVAAAWPLWADYVVLTSGETYIGEVITDAEDVVLIETMEGPVTVQKEFVESVTEAASVVGLYRDKAALAVTAADHFKLSTWCFDNGYPLAGDRELAQATAMDPEIVAATAAAADPKDKAVRTVQLRRAVAAVRSAMVTGSGKLEQSVARLADFKPEEKAPVLADQLHYTALKYNGYRAFLLDELAAMDLIDPAVFTRHVLREPEADLRAKTAAIMGRTPETRLLLENAMIDTLKGGAPMIARLNAAETLGSLHSSRGVSMLIQRVQQIWGPSARAHIFTSTTHAYVRDVTPVVAENSTSFDPEIDTYTTGTVLDVKIHSVEINTVIRALQTITNNYIENPGDWVKWWEDNGKATYSP
jgi:hypothetical protein